MKDRTREAIFNLLGGSLDGTLAIDLFAGSGILAMESLSRGASQAIAIEVDSRAAKDIRTNAHDLDPDMKLQVIHADAFYWVRSLETTAKDQPVPWRVFICPPYQLWEDQGEELLAMVQKICAVCPEGSYLAIELCVDYPVPPLPGDWEWDLRKYLPAIVAIGERKSGEGG